MTAYKYTDYAEYRKAQILGNAKKITLVFVSVDTVKKMSKFLKAYKPKIGICHGARNGAEVKWFNKYLKNCRTIGTDISGTAALFKNMLVHDFNKATKKFVNKFDFLYSNSWDHSYCIEKTLKVWKRQIKKGGFLLLETSPKHEKLSTELDPCRMDIEELKKCVDDNTKLKFIKKIKTEKGFVVVWQNE